MKFGVAPACAELLVYCSQTTLLFGVGIGALMPLLAMETFGQAHFGAIFGALTVGQIVPSLAGPLASGVLFDSSGHYLGAFGMVRVHRRLQTIRSHADLDGLFAALEHRRLCRGRLRTGADRRSPGQAAARALCPPPHRDRLSRHLDFGAMEIPKSSCREYSKTCVTCYPKTLFSVAPP